MKRVINQALLKKICPITHIPGTVKQLIGKRIVFLPESDFNTCVIKLRKVTIEDTGTWICDLETFHEFRGSGIQYRQRISLDVILKPTIRTFITKEKNSKNASNIAKNEQRAAPKLDILIPGDDTLFLNSGECLNIF